MSTPHDLFDASLRAASVAVHDAIAHLNRAGMSAKTAEAREEALAPVAGLQLALQFIDAISHLDKSGEADV